MKFPAHPLTRSQAERLIAAAARARTGTRDAAHLMVLYRTGMRCAESCSLDYTDFITLEDGAMVFRVEHPKGWENGAMPREIGIDPQAAAMVQPWLSARGSMNGPLFRTRDGGRVVPSHLRRLIPRLATRCGLGRRVHPHCFRHTFARELYDEGVGLVEIQLALGHTTLSTTQLYLRSIGATEVIAATTQRRSA